MYLFWSFQTQNSKWVHRVMCSDNFKLSTFFLCSDYIMIHDSEWVHFSDYLSFRMSSSYIHLFWSFQTYDSEWIHHIIWFDHCTLRMSTSWIMVNSKDPKWVHCVMYSDHFRLRLKMISFFICSDYLRLMIQNEFIFSDYLSFRMSSSYIHLFWSFQTYDSEWIHHIIWFDHCTLRMSTSWIIINSKDPKWVHRVMYSDHFRLRLKMISFSFVLIIWDSEWVHHIYICSDLSRLMTQNEFIIPLAFEEKQMSLAPKEEYVDPREKIREAIPTLEHSVSIRPNLDDASRYTMNCMAVLIEKCIICLTNTVFLSAFSTLIVIQVSSLQKKILKNTRTSKCFV